jgi:phosphoglycerate dehydrogenase-like enzyme
MCLAPVIRPEGAAPKPKGRENKLLGPCDAKHVGWLVIPIDDPLSFRQPDRNRFPMENTKLVQVAVLDDYQGVALHSADWSPLTEKAQVTVFRDHLANSAALVERLKPFDVLCVMRERTPLTREILEQLPELKLIASTGARNASIDLVAANERGITVCNTGYRANGAIEMTWALILALLRNIPAEFASVQAGQWQTSVGGDLDGKTIGLVGLGNIGGKIAKIAQAFGMKTIAWSQNLSLESADKHGATLVTKDELFRIADIVTVHLVLSPRTKGIVGAAELGLMKKTAYFINTSRGPLVDESALINALENRAIAGAALDVYEIEPLPASHPFRSLDRLLVTPHIGFVTEETYRIFYHDTVQNIVAWLSGTPVRVSAPPA